MKGTIFIFAILAAFIFLHPISALAATDAELIELAKVGTSNGLSSIKSYKGTVTLTTWILGENEKIGREISVISEGEKLRLSSKFLGSGLIYEAAFDGIKLTEWRMDQDVNQVIISEGFSGGIPYSDYNLFLNPRKLWSVNFSSRKNLKLVGREEIDGDDYIIVESSIASGDSSITTVKTWVNTKKGFTTTKHEASTIDNETGKILSKEVITFKMTQYAEELWGPVECSRAIYNEDGIKTSEVIAVYKDFQFNVPINEDELKLNLPSGTEVYDRILDAQYTIP